jgi:hypothetical protein
VDAARAAELGSATPTAMLQTSPEKPACRAQPVLADVLHVVNRSYDELFFSGIILST